MILDHVQLAMPPGSEDAARKYFRGILGMEEDLKPEPLQERGGCWFRTSGAVLHLGIEENFSPQKKAHVAFLVSDLRGLASRLVEAGYPLVWDSALPDRSRFYTNDPFGNRIEFIEDSAGFSQR